MSVGEPALWEERRVGTPRVDVIGIGQSSLDHVCVVDGLPAFAGKAGIERYRRLPGGQVATAMLACARLGLRAAFVGAVGDDEAAEVVLAPLRAAGVDVSEVRVAPGTPTQLAVILVDRASGERTVLWHRDRALSIQPGHLQRATITSARLLHLDGGDPAAGTWAARVARDAGIPVMLDVDTPAPGLSELLPFVDFPIVSQGFAETYFGSADPRDALGALVASGARMAVVTLGAIGALARIGETTLASAAFRVPVRDTTGAGDVFHAAYAYAVLARLGPERVLRVANAAAAMSNRFLGAQGGLPTRPELEAFLAANQPGPWRGPALD